MIKKQRERRNAVKRAGRRGGVQKLPFVSYDTDSDDAQPAEDYDTQSSNDADFDRLDSDEAEGFEDNNPIDVGDSDFASQPTTNELKGRRQHWEFLADLELRIRATDDREVPNSIEKDRQEVPHAIIDHAGKVHWPWQDSSGHHWIGQPIRMLGDPPEALKTPQKSSRRYAQNDFKTTPTSRQRELQRTQPQPHISTFLI